MWIADFGNPGQDCNEDDNDDNEDDNEADHQHLDGQLTNEDELGSLSEQ